MESLREDRLDIGGVSVLSGGESLTLAANGENPGEIRLDIEGVAELFRFLRSVILSPNDRRGAYRIPVPTAAGFGTTLYIDNRSIPAEAVNLSLSGVLLEPLSIAEVDIEHGTSLRVLLEFDGESVISDALVVRRIEGQYGLNFQNAGKGDEMDPLPGLARIMKKLEHHWAMEGWKA